VKCYFSEIFTFFNLDLLVTTDLLVLAVLANQTALFITRKNTRTEDIIYNYAPSYLWPNLVNFISDFFLAVLFVLRLS
jgi:hypothetical protein